MGNKGVECLKEGLLSSRSIARLVMASCNITNEGAVVMAEIVGDHTTLIHLDLRENNIRYIIVVVYRENNIRYIAVVVCLKSCSVLEILR